MMADNDATKSKRGGTRISDELLERKIETLPANFTFQRGERDEIHSPFGKSFSRERRGKQEQKERERESSSGRA